jgi:aminopeptidase-like protein
MIVAMLWVLNLSDGAHNILDIRCVLENDDFDRFWNQRSTAPKDFARAA